ncbi:uncharacterized protein LOC140705819 [Pogona vitticeps]
MEHRKGRRSSTLVTSEPVTTCQERQDEVEEVSFDKPDLVDEPSMAMTSTGTDLTEGEDIKKRWQEYTEELYQKDLGDPDSADADLESDILESEVKWALESMANNKVSGGDGIPVELFKILKDDAC